MFALKHSLSTRQRQALAGEPELLADALWNVSTLIEKLGMFTIEAIQCSRDQIVGCQQQELLELSTPVAELWAGILALPLIATLDSVRNQVVMESLREKIAEIGARIAIIDLTGVPTVDSLVAQHLMRTIAAARLMGADCLISGIRPQIALAIVHLGVNLDDVVTKATLADALIEALALVGSRAFEPRAIILDQHALRGRLRADSALSRIRLIAHTGFGSAQDREKTGAAGFDFHLIKPATLDELQQTLRRL